MTFSVIGRCDRTGKFGYAIATGTPSIGRRAIRVVPRRAVVAVQAGHNHYMITLAETLAQRGFAGSRLFDALEAADPYSNQRQFMFLDANGPGEARTGNAARAWKGHAVGPDFAAAGNVLAAAAVIDAMARAMLESTALELEDRLLLALEAGRGAGGQVDGERSAALFVTGAQDYPLYDLRVDLSPDPTGELRRAFDWYKPLEGYYQSCYESGEPALYKAHLRGIGWPVNPFAAEE